MIKKNKCAKDLAHVQEDVCLFSVRGVFSLLLIMEYLNRLIDKTGFATNTHSIKINTRKKTPIAQTKLEIIWRNI